MKRLAEYALIFSAGALGYSFIELLWRGRTHWTMVLTGGLCLTVIYFINANFSHRKLWERCVLGAIAVSIIEFNVGCIINIMLGWNVWDYSNIQYNILGQVCPLYSFFWFLLNIPVALLCVKVRKSIYTESE